MMSVDLTESLAKLILASTALGLIEFSHLPHDVTIDAHGPDEMPHFVEILHGLLQLHAKNTH